MQELGNKSNERISLINDVNDPRNAQDTLNFIIRIIESKSQEDLRFNEERLLKLGLIEKLNLYLNDLDPCHRVSKIEEISLHLFICLLYFYQNEQKFKHVKFNLRRLLNINITEENYDESLDQLFEIEIDILFQLFELKL